MKHFIVYENVTGRIIRTGVCSDEDFNNQGAFVIEGLAADDLQYISDGKVVDMPPKPAGSWNFDYSEKVWVEDKQAQEALVKQQRNRLLVQSDWTQLPDVPLSTKESWATYRQDLRDITAQEGYPFNVVWPTPPQ